MIQDCRWRRIDRQVQSIRDLKCYMIARNLISSRGRVRRHLDDLREKKRLAGDFFVGSTLAGLCQYFDTYVDLGLTGDYDTSSKQGWKGIARGYHRVFKLGFSVLENHNLGRWTDL